MTDDKSLPKEERKRLQIEHAHRMPREGALVKLADKICNLRDVAVNPPMGWSQDTGYCIGAINALAFLAPTECVEIPDGVTFLQVLLAIVQFIEAHPQRKDDAFVGLAFEALLEAWPCRRTPGPPP
jgi:hypothetical protein